MKRGGRVIHSDTLRSVVSTLENFRVLFVRCDRQSLATYMTDNISYFVTVAS